MGNCLLALLLILAVVFDLRTQKIPNGLTLPAIALGFLCHGWQEGSRGLGIAAAGMGVASLAMLPYAIRGLGAGDVKLLLAVGALAGPGFTLWTLLGSILAAGLLGLSYVARGVFVGRVGSAKAARMPLAPAIALGALFAFWRLHLGT